jgi:hypothetical protein
MPTSRTLIHIPALAKVSTSQMCHQEKANLVFSRFVPPTAYEFQSGARSQTRAREGLPPRAQIEIEILPDTVRNARR